MFTIKWVECGRESEPILTEASSLTNISKLVSACKQDLYRLRALYTDMPPDGFILIDAGIDRTYGTLDDIILTP